MGTKCINGLQHFNEWMNGWKLERNARNETQLVKSLEKFARKLRQKSESQNGGNKKRKHAKFSEKMNISYVCLSVGFLSTSVFRLAHLSYYRQKLLGTLFDHDILVTSTLKLQTIDWSKIIFLSLISMTGIVFIFCVNFKRI